MQKQNEGMYAAITRCGLIAAVVVGAMGSTAHADPVQDLSMQGYRAGWFPNYYKGKGPLSCPDTCEVWTQSPAEGERVNDLWKDARYAFVCKITRDEAIIEKGIDDPTSHWMYGTQFDGRPLCYTAFPSGKAYRTDHFMCLCVERASSCEGPDLVVSAIQRPVWTGSASSITVEITNIGSAPAGPSVTYLEDYQYAAGTASAATPSIAPGSTATLTFTLPYWVYDPDASLRVTADYKRQVKECNEDNDVREFFEMG